MPARLALSALAGALLLAGCAPGGDVPADGAPADGAPASADAAGVEVSGGLDEKPGVTLPDGDPPAELIVVDIVDGDGDVAETDSVVTTHYLGVSWTNREQFDASWDRGEPIAFGLNQVIAGWGEGIPGMRVGGRRLLVIPPDLAYGEASPTAAIAPNDTLVFVIDLVEVQ